MAYNLQLIAKGGIFLDFNLTSFGQLLKDIRKDLGLSLNSVSELSYIHVETIRRIENGKVIPKFETLESLSPIYKQDLNSLFLKFRIDDYSYFYKIKNRLEFKFDTDEFHTLNVELNELNELIKYINNSYYKSLINQLILLVEAVILYKNKKNYKIGLDKLIKAIKISTPDFSLSNYREFIYSDIEIRILMNISFILNKLKQKEKYLELMEFCFKSIDYYDVNFPKICYNLSGAYRRSKDYNKALELSNLAIKSSQETRNYNGLSLLYYGKGICEYFLNMEEYMESIIASINLCKYFGQTALKEKFEKNCIEVLGMKLNCK